MTDRARIPFALIGVLLLAASGSIVVSQHDPVVTEPAVDRAMDRATAETQAALRSAVRDAAHAAARRPVLEPANTTVGAALNESRPFADALRLRIYLAARANLAGVSTTRHGVDLSASLPPIEAEDDVRAAIDRLALERAGPDGGMLRVEFEDVSLTGHRNGRLVGTVTRSPALVVDVPVLAVHDRVERFDDRLDRPVGEPGLASRLSATLYPIAWARGHAQFRGGPIENVVANEHVTLLANRALLAEQRRVFGVRDPVGRRVFRETLAETAVTDFLGAVDPATLDKLDRARRAVGWNRTSADRLAGLEPPGDWPRPSETTTVSAGRAADRAYLAAAEAVPETVATTYAPLARVRADVRTTHREPLSSHAASSAWTLVRERTSYDTTVRTRSGAPPAAADGWHRLEAGSRTVDVVKRTVRTWKKPTNETTRTRARVDLTREVDLVVEGNHTVGPAPDGPVSPVHEAGGPVDGPNLADARERLLAAVVRDRGGLDRLAGLAATERLDERPTPVQAPRPDGIVEWAGQDLLSLRRAVADVSIEVARGDVATFRRNVPAALADRLRERKSALVDPPGTYDGVARRARVGVRADYVDRVVSLLDERARGHERAKASVDEALPSTVDPAGDVLAAGYSPVTVRPGTDGGPERRMAVDASPGYLPVEPVGHETVPAIPTGRTEHPLVVRNVNGVTLPVRGAVDALLGLLSGPEKTSLRSGVQVLQTADEVDADGTRVGLARAMLEDEVAATVETFRLELRRELARHGLGSRTGRRRVVSSALDHWAGPAGRAAALVNGSAAAAVHREALSRWPNALENDSERRQLAIALDLAVVEGRERERLQPRLATVNATASLLREELGVAGEVGGDVAGALSRRGAAAMAARLPGGLPLAPSPGLWYATVNAWHVQVRGSYARFAVRVPRGSPEHLPPDLTYVRENRTVSLDVDRDGDPERLGYNRRIEFDAETVVGVAVPPGPPGVGDVGERDERSPGWPEPGPVGDGK